MAGPTTRSSISRMEPACPPAHSAPTIGQASPGRYVSGVQVFEHDARIPEDLCLLLLFRFRLDVRQSVDSGFEFIQQLPCALEPSFPRIHAISPQVHSVIAKVLWRVVLVLFPACLL